MALWREAMRVMKAMRDVNAVMRNRLRQEKSDERARRFTFVAVPPARAWRAGPSSEGDSLLFPRLAQPGPPRYSSLRGNRLCSNSAPASMSPVQPELLRSRYVSTVLHKRRTTRVRLIRARHKTSMSRFAPPASCGDSCSRDVSLQGRTKGT